MKKRFLLRLDPEAYDALAKWAADDLRSVNGQMEYLLVQALRRAGRLRMRSAIGREDEAEGGGRVGEAANPRPQSSRSGGGRIGHDRDA